MIERPPHPKFRLLVLSSDPFPPTRVDVSVLFGEELAGRGHQIDWILQSEADCERPYVTQWGGGTVWVAPSNSRNSLWSRLAKHAASIANDARVFRLLRGDRYDAIEVKDKFIGGVFAVLAARLFGKRFVYWLSFPFPEFYLTQARDGLAPYPWLYRLRGLGFQLMLYKILLPAADHVFVQSEQMRRDVAAHGIPLSKLTAVPMGIKMDSRASLPAGRVRSRIPQGQPCFMYLGSLSRERRIDFLLRVLARVLPQMPDAKLYLVGKGELPGDEESLQRRGSTSSGWPTRSYSPDSCRGRPPSSTSRMRMSVYRRSFRHRFSTWPRPPSWLSTWPWARPLWPIRTPTRSCSSMKADAAIACLGMRMPLPMRS